MKYVWAPDLIFCFFTEAGVETILYHTFLRALIVTNRRSTWLARKQTSLLSTCKSRRFMLNDLFFDTFDQTPAIFVTILLHLPCFEAGLWRQEWRFVKIALFELPCQFMITRNSSSNILLPNVIATQLYIMLLLLIESLGAWCKNWMCMLFENFLPFLYLLLALKLFLTIVSSCLESRIRCLELSLFMLMEARLTRSKRFVELFGGSRRTNGSSR